MYQGKLYLFGGGAPFPTKITTTQIYDPDANSWSTGPSMNVGRVWFYGGSIDNTSIVAPGGDNRPGIEINDNEQLTASWAIKAPLPFVSRGPFAVSDGTFVYIGGGYDGATVHPVASLRSCSKYLHATGAFDRCPLPVASGSR